MRLLLDECVDERVRFLFPGHDCRTARFAKVAGLRNGRLLDAAEAAGFDILITVDQNIPDQQNLARRRISLIVLCGRTNRLRDLRATRARRDFGARLSQTGRCSENRIGAMKKKIPEFRSEDEEREFWATADSTEYVDWHSGERKKLAQLKPGLMENGATSIGRPAAPRDATPEGEEDQ